MSVKRFTDYIAETTEEGEVAEVATAAQRIKMKQAFKKNKGKIARAKERAAKKVASPEQLKTRAMNQARNMFIKKILGPGKTKADLSLSDRAQLEKRLDKKKAAIAKLAKKLLPKIKADDRAKVAAKKEND